MSDIDQRSPERLRAVVTGGAGFLGSHLCDALLARGAEVLCIDDFSTGSIANIAHLLGSDRFRLIEADVGDALPDLPALDLVLHAAAPAGVADFLAAPRAALRTLAVGTGNALDLAETHRARLVLLSTCDVTTPDALSDPALPTDAFALARRFAEVLTASRRSLSGSPTTVVRVGTVYGPRMREDLGHAVPGFVRAALRGEPVLVPGSGASRYPLCYVSDVVRGVLAAADRSVPGPIDIGGAGVALAALAQRVITLTGSSSSIEFTPFPAPSPAARLPETGLARELLGWCEEVSLDDGLRSTVAGLGATPPAYA